MDHRLERLGETLNKNTVISAMALKELLGITRLEAIMDEKAELHYNLDCFVAPLRGAPRNDGEGKFKPYYVAHTKIQALALLDEKHKGSNWLQWRRGWDSNPRDSEESSGFQDRPVLSTSVPLHWVILFKKLNYCVKGC